MSHTPLFGLDRRNFLRVASAGVVGATWPTLSVSANESGKRRPEGFGKAKSVLIVLLSGGPSQLDMLDPKPEAPAEVRGEFKPIGTTIPGVQVCEHLPKLAKQTDRWAIVRTLAHREHNHLLATHVALTGRPTPIPRGGSDLDRVESRNDFPNFAAALDFVQPRTDGIPSGVSLPNYLIEGPLTWPGQHAGFLGAKHDPWQINGDPNNKDFQMQALAMREGMSTGRLQSRRELLESLNRGHTTLTGTETNSLRDQQSLAYNLLTSGKLTQAFDINRESDETRDRYGRNKFGQSLLLSKRMVEAGVPVVQATMGIVQTWDTHVDNWGKLKNTLLPQLDQGLEALTDDLQSSGLLDETLLIVMGEFGRTPRVSTLPGQTIPGRDHWAHAYSGLFAGAGIQGGQVLGQTDAQAAYPITNSWSPADICSTVFNALGVDEETTISDPLQRPHPLLNGKVISNLYTGASA
ncbi:DUF1501 domain-containing protein [Bremerella cremea]|uniref:DUF1501 domain-containing protein n=1 Tax=Blastopirellula marina TaxID=124 RepID=A0A2S8G538_9BACT|nr:MULTISPECIES: DUF1501 domain-containing protein [Pirellulaceae]PQO39533.1 DUF1501 domain-containing protein [Blastopirellula marina]RCS51000.1 DUF1501 domain-containing protein [Bremerella cremea]